MDKGSKDVAVGFCLDESGSMASCTAATIKGFNDYMKSLRGQDGKTFVTLTQFSSQRGQNFRQAFSDLPVKSVPKLTTGTYQPGGGTPLLDAIGHTITGMDEWLEAREGDEPNVIVVIQTDGYENASTDYSRAKIVKMIRKREKKGWLFVYLGADQDAIQAEQIGASMGMSKGATFAYASASTGATFDSLGDSTSYMRSARAAGQHVTSADVSNVTKASYAQRTGTQPEGALWDEATQSWVVPAP